MTIEEFRDYILFKLLDEDVTNFKYVAVDEDGHTYIYSERPHNNFDDVWDSKSPTCRLAFIFDIDLGNCGIDWEDTLVEL